MNKIMTKLSGLFLGLAMMVGVGVGVSINKINEVKAVSYGTSETIACPAGTVTGSTTGDKKITFNTDSFTIVHANDGNISSSVASYSPWRIYANHTITISSIDGTTKIAKIEATTNSTYYGSWSASGWTINVANTSGGKSTFTNDSGSTSVTLKTSAQARWSSLTIYPLSTTPQYASPYILGIEEDDLYSPTQEDIDLSIEWGSGTMPTITSYKWTVSNDAVSLSNDSVANPKLSFNDAITTYNEVTISLKVNNDDNLSDSVNFVVAPHTFDSLSISDSRKSEFSVNEDFSIGTPSITAKYVDKVNKTLSASELTYYIGGTKTSGTQINLGDKMLEAYNGKKLYAYYTDVTSHYTSWNITVTDRVMPTPIFDGGWNKVSSGSLNAGDRIIFVGTFTDTKTTEPTVMGNVTAGSNIPGVTGVTFNNDKSKVTSLPQEAAIVCVETGTKTNTVSFYYEGKDKDNKDTAGYLTASGGTKNNKLTIDTEKTDNGSFSYSFNSGTITLTAQGDSSRNVMQYNPNSGSPIFACYGDASQKAVSIYREELVNTDKAYVQQWINDYLHFQTIATSEKGTGECISSSLYSTAKTNLLSINEEHSTTTNAIILALVNVENVEFFEAVERYEAWALANNDSKPYGDTGIEPVTRGLKINFLSNNIQNLSSSTWIIAVIAVVGLSAIGAYFFYHKRKEI